MQPKESKSKTHFIVSLFKSTIRIVAGITLIVGDPIGCGILLVTAEVLGIIEEF